MPNMRTGTLKLKDCDCKVHVKPMSKSIEPCDKHKNDAKFKNYLLRAAHVQFNWPTLPNISKGIIQ